MIRGMTGFGCADLSLGKIKGTIEIKSLNHRYLDIGYFLPIGFASAESKIRDLISGDIERGRITVSLKLSNKPAATVTFNTEAIKTYLKYANVIKKEFKLSGSLTLPELIQLPGVVESRETFLSPDELWPAIEKGCRSALAGLLTMRGREGKNLASHIDKILKLMLLQIKKIQSRTKLILKEKKKILTDEEFVSFQKSSDINEETARLTHHIDEFRLLLRTNVAVGKKLDFIAQEMQRETNTIGSKVQDKFVSNAVIALKSKIEKIREQSQNIE